MESIFKKNFVIEEEHDKVAVGGRLICDCGCEMFDIYHTGKQTKGILSSHIVEKDKQIFIEAKCSKCGKIIQIYDSSLDDEKISRFSSLEKQQFSHKEITSFKVKIFLNYYEENYLTNKFVSIYIHLIDDNKKEIVLYEK